MGCSFMPVTKIFMWLFPALGVSITYTIKAEYFVLSLDHRHLFIYISLMVRTGEIVADRDAQRLQPRFFLCNISHACYIASMMTVCGFSLTGALLVGLCFYSSVSFQLFVLWYFSGTRTGYKLITHVFFSCKCFWVNFNLTFAYLGGWNGISGRMPLLSQKYPYSLSTW